jgi:hypothetical protein
MVHHGSTAAMLKDHLRSCISCLRIRQSVGRKQMYLVVGVFHGQQVRLVVCQPAVEELKKTI